MVALHASALIEIYYPKLKDANGNSRTPCECVDWNRLTKTTVIRLNLSHSMRVRWLKLQGTYNQRFNKISRTPCECVDWNARDASWRDIDWASHSMRVRWLKSEKDIDLGRMLRSHSMRVRWLKSRWQRFEVNNYGRTPCECVDWNLQLWYSWQMWMGRTPCECVDWNALSASWFLWTLCRTPCECVDWNISKRLCERHSLRRTPCECVDWNRLTKKFLNSCDESHSMRVRWLKYFNTE